MIKRKHITYRDFNKSIDLPIFVSNIKTKSTSSTSLWQVLLNAVLENSINIHATTILNYRLHIFSMVLSRTFNLQEDVRKL